MWRRIVLSTPGPPFCAELSLSGRIEETVTDWLIGELNDK